jgi:glucose-1-phosphate thymidylyltransferase
MIYYPLSTLMWTGSREILIVTTPEDQEAFRRLLGDGSWLGMKFSWAVQPSPGGIAQALLIGKDFLAGKPCALALGDNVFYGQGLPESLLAAAHHVQDGASLFTYWVRDPQRYGVVDFGPQGNIRDILEKPKQPPSSWAVTGLYLYDGTASERASKLKPSARGELEITDLNRDYLNNGRLRVEKLGRGIAWLDTGTPDAMLQASTFIQAIEERQGLKICCPEEVAYRLRWISSEDVLRLAGAFGSNPYGVYLRSLLEPS